MNDSLKNWPIDIKGNQLPADEIITTEEYVEKEKASHKKYFHYRNMFFISLLLFAYVIFKYIFSNILPIYMSITLFIILFFLCLVTFTLCMTSYRDWKHNAQMLYIHNMPKSESDELFRNFCEVFPDYFKGFCKNNPKLFQEFYNETEENKKWCDSHPEFFNNLKDN